MSASEIFKSSVKSICHKCSITTSKTCGTDRKIKCAYVMNCSHFNNKTNNPKGG